MLHKIIAVTYDSKFKRPKKSKENMEIPHPLICAYHNEILFCNSFGLAKRIFFYLCTCKYLIGLLFWFYFFLFDLDVKVILDKGVYTLVSRTICVLILSVVVNDQR